MPETDYNPAARKPLWLLFQDGDSPKDPFLAFSHHVSTQSRRAIQISHRSALPLRKKNHLVPSGRVMKTILNTRNEARVPMPAPRVPNRFFGTWDLHYLKLGIRDLKEKSGRVSRLKVCTGGGMPKITLGITELHEIVGRDYGI